MIKMRAPEGVTAFSHQGYPVEIDGDGAAHVDARHRTDLEAHGFVPWDRPAPEGGAAVVAPLSPDPRRARLIALFADRIAGMSDDEIVAMEANAEAQIRMEREDADRLDPKTVTVEDIDAMKRHELFAFLRKAGIPAVPPIENEALRVKARAALVAA